jgi:hypothetical protein
MKRVNIIGLSILSSIILAGCGGGGSSGTVGTGYYVDSAVAGVEYHCGSQNGVTASDGSFNYISGDGCRFSVADVTLREVPANELDNGKYILEDNIEVARFLQSLDNDGNPDNGIQIDKDVVKALKKTLKERRVPKDAELEEVVAQLHNEVPHYNGHVKDKSEVEHHLNRTKQEVQKHNQEIEKEKHEHGKDDHGNGDHGKK